MTTWNLRAFGDPAPKGSWDIVPSGQPVIDGFGEKRWRVSDMHLRPASSDRLARWKHCLELAALEAGRPHPPLTEVPIGVTVIFIMRRPQRCPSSHHVVEPDLDKLTRAVGDVLTGIYWHDDKQIVMWNVGKRYATAGEKPGAEIEIEVIDEKKTLDLPIDMT